VALTSAAGGVACQSIILTSSILLGVDVQEAAKGYAKATEVVVIVLLLPKQEQEGEAAA
jgi:hypothetical protein